MRRKRTCELCGDAAGAHGLDLGTRLVTLCAQHARQAEQAKVTTLEALRALFVEAGGQRSLLARRAASERRLFPPRPEGRRQWRGRRQSDAVSTLPTALPGRR
jgi:hypothetical protein